MVLTANVGFLAIQSIDQPGAERTMGQILSYMSLVFSSGNVIACTILARQHRRSTHRYAEDAVRALFVFHDLRTTLTLRTLASLYRLRILYGAPRHPEE